MSDTSRYSEIHSSIAVIFDRFEGHLQSLFQDKSCQRWQHSGQTWWELWPVGRRICDTKHGHAAEIWSGTQKLTPWILEALDILEA